MISCHQCRIMQYVDSYVQTKDSVTNNLTFRRGSRQNGLESPRREHKRCDWNTKNNIFRTCTKCNELKRKVNTLKRCEPSTVIHSTSEYHPRSNGDRMKNKRINTDIVFVPVIRVTKKKTSLTQVGKVRSPCSILSFKSKRCGGNPYIKYSPQPSGQFGCQRDAEASRNNATCKSISSYNKDTFFKPNLTTQATDLPLPCISDRFPVYGKCRNSESKKEFKIKKTGGGCKYDIVATINTNGKLEGWKTKAHNCKCYQYKEDQSITNCNQPCCKRLDEATSTKDKSSCPEVRPRLDEIEPSDCCQNTCRDSDSCLNFANRATTTNDKNGGSKNIRPRISGYQAERPTNPTMPRCPTLIPEFHNSGRNKIRSHACTSTDQCESYKHSVRETLDKAGFYKDVSTGIKVKSRSLNSKVIIIPRRHGGQYSRSNFLKTKPYKSCINNTQTCKWSKKTKYCFSDNNECTQFDSPCVVDPSRERRNENSCQTNHGVQRNSIMLRLRRNKNYTNCRKLRGKKQSLKSKLSCYLEHSLIGTLAVCCAPCFLVALSYWFVCYLFTNNCKKADENFRSPIYQDMLSKEGNHNGIKRKCLDPHYINDSQIHKFDGSPRYRIGTFNEKATNTDCLPKPCTKVTSTSNDEINVYKNKYKIRISKRCRKKLSPNPKKKYNLYYRNERGWVMKPTSDGPSGGGDNNLNPHTCPSPKRIICDRVYYGPCCNNTEKNICNCQKTLICELNNNEEAYCNRCDLDLYQSSCPHKTLCDNKAEPRKTVILCEGENFRKIPEPQNDACICVPSCECPKISFWKRIFFRSKPGNKSRIHRNESDKPKLGNYFQKIRLSRSDENSKMRNSDKKSKVGNSDEKSKMGSEDNRSILGSLHQSSDMEKTHMNSKIGNTSQDSKTRTFGSWNKLNHVDENYCSETDCRDIGTTYQDTKTKRLGFWNKFKRADENFRSQSEKHRTTEKDSQMERTSQDSKSRKLGFRNKSNKANKIFRSETEKNMSKNGRDSKMAKTYQVSKTGKLGFWNKPHSANENYRSETEKYRSRNGRDFTYQDFKKRMLAFFNKFERVDENYRSETEAVCREMTLGLVQLQPSMKQTFGEFLKSASRFLKFMLVTCCCCPIFFCVYFCHVCCYSMY